MGAVGIEVDMLQELLEAAARTALSHRDTEHECYVLGQLEATANMIYALLAGSGHVELELYCQQLAVDALDRHAELVARGSARKPLAGHPNLTSVF